MAIPPLRLVLLSAALLSLVPFAAIAGEPVPSTWQQTLRGNWEGRIQAGTAAILTVFHFEVGEKGELSGTVDSPEQGAFGLPMGTIARNEDGMIAVTVPTTQASYAATLSEDATRLVGTWSQRGHELPLELHRVLKTKATPIKEAKRFAGIWEGALDLGSIKLRLAFRLATRKDGSLGGTLDSPDQGAKDIPLGRVDIPEQGKLSIDVIGARFVGTLDDSTGQLKGSFSQNGKVLPLTLSHVKHATTLNRPQTPTPPFPYEQREVEYAGLDEGVRLAGTLTLPRSGGPFPALLLITGSGAQDRDETIFAHKPFFVIADDLSRHGIAVLRVDDRGFGKSVGPSGTTADFARDVQAGVAFLAGLADIDSQRIGLLGHSEGGLIAPMVAAGSDRIDFIILLAGPGTPGDQLILDQTMAFLHAAGESEETIASSRRVQEKLMALVKDESLPTKEIASRAREVLLSEPKLTEEEGVKAQLESQLQLLQNEWTIFFIRYDPLPALERVRCPVLAINGSKDLQVLAGPNLAGIARALKKGGNRDVTIKEFPGLNHLLQPCKTGLIDEYSSIETTIDPAVLQLLESWILSHVTKPASAGNPR